MKEKHTEQNAEFTLDLNNLPEMSNEVLERLKAMTDDDIETSALSDPDNPPCTNNELVRFYKVVDEK